MSENQEIQLYIIDNARLVRNGLKALLADYTELEIIGTASSPEEAIEECTQLQPDTILMEVMVDDGIDLVKQLIEVSPDSNIIILTYKQDRNPVFEALQAGVAGYLIKDMSTEDLVDAIIETDDGKQVIAHEVISDLVDQTRDSDPDLGKDLTRREREVLELMPEGLTNKELARKLHVSPSTIKNHISNILAKLEAESRVSAVAIALRNNLVD